MCPLKCKNNSTKYNKEFYSYLSLILQKKRRRKYQRKEVTNLDYENEIQDKKINIFLLKTEYLNVVFNDLDDIMEYKKGSTQYVSETLKRAENIRLYPNS